MPVSEYEIVLLRPTEVFLSFLKSQLPGTKLPDLRLLQIDNTAYVIRKQHSDEDTLDEIERYFTRMFRHEISRWLGESVRHKIESSFLDFLCCFKFELHNHIILMEPAINQGQQLLLMKPRRLLLDWIKASLEGDEGVDDVIDQVHLSHLEENASVMVKNFANLMDVKPFMQQHYPSLYTSLMSRISGLSDQWPLVDSFQTFSQYFSVEIHTQLIYLPN